MSGRQARQVTQEDADALVRALNARDFEAVQELWYWDPEVEFRSALATAEGEAYRGIDGLRTWAENADATWEDFRIEVVDFRRALDDQFVTVFHVTGRARASGVPLDTRTAQVWTFREGRAWRNESYTDPREAFRTAGLAE